MLHIAIQKIYCCSIKNNLVATKISFFLLLVTIINLNINSAIAQINNIAIDRNTISQPITLRGRSGGEVAATEITKTKNTSTGYCNGFANRQPNHIIKIDSFFNSLRLEVKSAADTTILVRGAGGTWCNDDAGSANPIVQGQWQPGIYQIWVGSYQADSKNEYTIEISSN